MARKIVRQIRDASSDDDAPEVVSHSTSKSDVKRSQKALHDFEAEERARRKAHNREKDQKLKERARVTREGRTSGKIKGVRFADQVLVGEDAGECDVDGGDDDDVEARMLRAMGDAVDEGESDAGEEDDDDDDDEFRGFEQELDSGDDMTSGSDISFSHDEDDEDALKESDSIDPEAPTDDEAMDEDEGTTSLQTNIQKPRKRADYLADDLFRAAFAPQRSSSDIKKNAETTQYQTVKKRRRKSNARVKDLVIGGRTIRMLPQLSDPRSQATSRSVPSAQARKFVEQSLALKGKRALLMAKKKGWERRPANIGVMKCRGAANGFVRNTR